LIARKQFALSHNFAIACFQPPVLLPWLI
jgi:hypothetical protein